MNDEDDMSWKQLKSDVFRPPGNPIVLASMVGIGIQLSVMLILTVVFIALYYLAEQYRTEKFLEALIVLYVVAGLLSGIYFSIYSNYKYHFEIKIKVIIVQDIIK